ncbi:hypothetical protein [Kyrpidia tusciae]|nr:hypothetical protein [Kyrpidia tusciae]
MPAKVKVRKGLVTVQHRGRRLAPGWYEVTEGGRVVVKKRPPKLKKG